MKKEDESETKNEAKRKKDGRKKTRKNKKKEGKREGGSRRRGSFLPSSPFFHYSSWKSLLGDYMMSGGVKCIVVALAIFFSPSQGFSIMCLLN